MATALSLASELIRSRRAKKSGPPSFRKTGRYNLATTYSRKTFRQTTIGAAAFHFRVRDGNGWFHRAMVTRTGALSPLAAACRDEAMAGGGSAAVPRTRDGFPGGKAKRLISGKNGAN